MAILWAKIIKHHRVIDQTTVHLEDGALSDAGALTAALRDALSPMDIAQPVLLSHHLRDLRLYLHCTLQPGDFMDTVRFDSIRLEVLDDDE